MSSSIPVNIRKPDGSTYTVRRESIRYHPASTATCVIFVGETLMGHPITFRPDHLVRVRRVDLHGSTMRPAGIKYQPVDTTERDARELEAIKRRIAILEEQLSA